MCVRVCLMKFISSTVRLLERVGRFYSWNCTAHFVAKTRTVKLFTCVSEYDIVHFCHITSSTFMSRFSETILISSLRLSYWKFFSLSSLHSSHTFAIFSFVFFSTLYICISVSRSSSQFQEKLLAN